MKLKVIKSVVHATPRNLSANWTMEIAKEGEEYYNNRGTEYTEIALDFLKYGYNLTFYLTEFGGPQCRQGVKNKYRPVYTLNIKHKAWFIELFAED